MIRRAPLRLLAGVLFGGLATGLAPAALAQQQTPPERLPSLSPREFIIPGQATVNLPQIERQPLSGFGPPPRSFVVPADRQPATQPYDPALDGLAPLVLAPPREPETDLPEGHRGRLEGGAGAYLARYGRLDLSLPVAAGRLYADLDYDGINAGGEDLYVPSDRFAGRVGVQTYGQTRLRIEGTGFREGYGMAAIAPEVRRVRSHYGAAGALEGVGEVPFALHVRYGFSRVSPADALDELALGETSEGRVGGEVRLGLLGNRLRLEAAGSTAGLDGGVGNDERHGTVGAAVALGREDGARLVAGVRALAYRASEANGLGRSTTFGPVIGLGLPLGPALRLFATNEPRLRTRSLHDLFADNPFAAPEAIVAPDVRPVDAEVGVELRRGPLRARAFALATYATTELHFQPSAGGLYSTVYAGTRTAGVGADATLVFGRGATVSAAVALRDGALTDDGGALPFFAPLAGRVGVQVPFNRGRGRLGLSGYAENTRPTEPTGEFTAPAWAQLDLDARYALAGPLALVVRAERLAGTAERWPGYPYAPYTVMGGLRLAW